MSAAAALALATFWAVPQARMGPPRAEVQLALPSGEPLPEDEVSGGPPLARVHTIQGRVEYHRSGRWREAADRERVMVGDRLRTGPGGVALVELPWTQMVVGPAAEMRFSPSRVLSAQLVHGRLEQRAEGAIVKVRTEDGEVRGAGGVVVTRTPQGTAVMVRDGHARLGWGRRSQVVEAGGAAILARRNVSRVDPPAAPSGAWPGPDPVYVAPGAPVEVRWSGSAPRYTVRVSALDGAGPLSVLDTPATAATLAMGEAGTYRWEVIAVDARGVESAPLAAGLFCVVR